ncbi:MAG: DUF2634 domain-containing protein [Oscillospiraceae bacterium]|nr:DUF2634 domain-containing protein [Oscillospiraceae bacterium]
MLPNGFYDVADEFGNESLRKEYSEKTYNLENLSGGKTFIDGREAISQAVVKILNTERFRHPIYSTDYGIELADLFGRDCDYVCVELERRIKEALLSDSRILRVVGFNFVQEKNIVRVTFTVYSIYGEHKLEAFEFYTDRGKE